jgi:hypothetical protein
MFGVCHDWVRYEQYKTESLIFEVLLSILWLRGSCFRIWDLMTHPSLFRVLKEPVRLTRVVSNWCNYLFQNRTVLDSTVDSCATNKFPRSFHVGGGTVKANSHMPCRAHAAPMPFTCHAVLLKVYIVSFPYDLHRATLFNSHIPCLCPAMPLRKPLLKATSKCCVGKQSQFVSRSIQNT